MESKLWDTLSQTSLYLDQTSKPLEIDRDEVRHFYEPLARAVLVHSQPDRRELVAVAGPPGSGKSAFAATLTAVINAMTGSEQAVLVGMDGWHFPNAYLDSHTITRDGETFPLRVIKGAPETYNHDGIWAFLSRAHAPARLVFPVYSRVLHDPIAESGTIEAWQRFVVLEGNYWLLDESPWRRYRPLFDLSIFLRAEPANLLAGLRERHLRGRKDPGFVEKHMQRVDLPNIDRVLVHSGSADVIVDKMDSRRISGMTWASDAR